MATTLLLHLDHHWSIQTYYRSPPKTHETLQCWHLNRQQIPVCYRFKHGCVCDVWASRHTQGEQTKLLKIRILGTRQPVMPTLKCGRVRFNRYSIATFFLKFWFLRGQCRNVLPNHIKIRKRKSIYQLLSPNAIIHLYKHYQAVG